MRKSPCYVVFIKLRKRSTIPFPGGLAQGTQGNRLRNGRGKKAGKTGKSGRKAKNAPLTLRLRAHKPEIMPTTTYSCDG
ncbi:hypothetical protein D4100_17335 [Serratia inhibens]|uniref:Uncharacterized protein n=1 Tax=Serratia inhibens TaxID=2338073 RepID=A0AA92X426_9GAMM|nr:hypothetical protein D4100_17335 [Serratia inhibens]